MLYLSLVLSYRLYSGTLGLAGMARVLLRFSLGFCFVAFVAERCAGVAGLPVADAGLLGGEEAKFVFLSSFCAETSTGPPSRITKQLVQRNLFFSLAKLIATPYYTSLFSGA